MSQVIVAREPEIKALESIYQSNEAEFVAVYGRRRVGKTFLVKHFFKQKEGLFFQITGIYKASIKTQLAEFRKELEVLYANMGINVSLQDPKNWLDAFEKLTEAIKLADGRVVLFFDEFPWMARRRSKIVQALEYYWNRHWVDNENLKLIICGSAASWIIENILNSKGGLHNRVTLRLPMSPFTLRETKQYLLSRGVTLDNMQILQLYLCIGGIPFYLKAVQQGLSATQNINTMCFSKQGALFGEFDNLLASLFKNAEKHEKIVKLLATKPHGVSRKVIEKVTDYKGGNLTKVLKELEHAGFVENFKPWGRQRGSFYKLIDEYCLFYLNWVAPASEEQLLKEINTSFWEVMSQSSAWKAWSGYAFEAVCFKHLKALKAALNIPDGAIARTWQHVPQKGSKLPGAQIDLLFDRMDGVITVCEIKYSNAPYTIDKAYAAVLANRLEVYKEVSKTNKQISLSMVTTYGLKPSAYLEGLVWSEGTAEDLFK